MPIGDGMLPAARSRHLLPLLLALLAVAAPATADAGPRTAAATASAAQAPGDTADGWEDLDGDGWPDEGEWSDDSGFDDGTDAGVPTALPAPVTDVGATPTATPVPAVRPTWPKVPAAPKVPAVPVEPEVPLVTTATVPGKVAMLRKGGRAAIPRRAPLAVRRVIAAANRIVGKPYKWGGGHAQLEDRGYDCSGTVGYALIRAQLLQTTMVSGTFARWGRAGAGTWITIYANRGHVYMEVAGLRLDTSAMGDPRGGSGPRWRPAIGKRGGFHVRHPAGL